MLTDNQIIRLILAFKVRSRRLEMGLSYQNLSDSTKLSTSYLSDIEKGKRYPKPDKIEQLAGALDLSYDYLVSKQIGKNLKPVIDLISSNFFKLFPLQEFGISMDKAIELFSQTPDRVNAFISTFFKIARNYQITDREFYLESLRSYQNFHNNYFQELEDAAQMFREDFSLKSVERFDADMLEEQLLELYDIRVDYEELSQNKTLSILRSLYSPKRKILYLSANLNAQQASFLMARELGFQYLELEERPYETRIRKIDSFEILYNNYKASHFAAALLIPAESISQKLKQIFESNTWNAEAFSRLLQDYNITSETLMQRMTNILPKHFGLEDLFFIKLSGSSDLSQLKMQKELHLSQLHTPYNNLLDENFCRRWVGCRSIQDSSHHTDDYILNIQISTFWQTDKSYLSIAMADPSQPYSSVTLGLLINEKLRTIVRFLDDETITRKTVNTTCQRCDLADCKDRVADGVYVTQDHARSSLLEEIQRYM